MANMSPRMERVADQLQRELAVLIQQELKDPRLGMVSVTGVTVSRDLGYADVYVTALDQAITGRDYRPAAADSEAPAADSGKAEGGEPAGEPEDKAADVDADGGLEAEGAERHRQALKILNGASGFLRSRLGKRLSLRIIPRLRFHYDESIAHGRYLSSLIESAVAADKKRQ
ncbi:MAG: 30S ribosome-binding factor RbfA [Pseudohongiellaceae bacterium]